MKKQLLNIIDKNKIIDELNLSGNKTLADKKKHTMQSIKNQTLNRFKIEDFHA